MTAPKDTVIAELEDEIFLLKQVQEKILHACTMYGNKAVISSVKAALATTSKLKEEKP